MSETLTSLTRHGPEGNQDSDRETESLVQINGVWTDGK